MGNPHGHKLSVLNKSRREALTKKREEIITSSNVSLRKEEVDLLANSELRLSRRRGSDNHSHPLH